MSKNAKPTKSAKGKKTGIKAGVTYTPTGGTGATGGGTPGGYYGGFMKI
jgi:hypothetical protein